MSNQQNQETTSNPFEAIRRTHDQGEEYWSARELGTLLGYTEYGKFRGAITRAEKACEGSGYAVSDHFAHASDMVTIGSGARREVADVHLSRYACYLIVQNADPEKPIVALGQTYFAVRTREAELTEQATLQGMGENQLRLYVRAKLTDYNKQLADAAYAAGVPSTGFATFQNHGYRGLYAGETAKDIAARKGVKPGQILDHMNSDELAANLFRSSLTGQKIRNDPTINTQAAANQTHYDVGADVRRFIIEHGGTPPEELPTPAQSIQQLQRQEQRAEQKRIEADRQPARQSSLFRADDGDDDDSSDE